MEVERKDQTFTSIKIELSPAEAKRLKEIMGYDIDIPKLVGGGDKLCYITQQFMGELHSHLRAALTDL